MDRTRIPCLSHPSVDGDPAGGLLDYRIITDPKGTWQKCQRHRVEAILN